MRRPVEDKALRPVGPPTETKAAPDAPRCWRCGRLLAVHLTPPWAIVCSRCKARNAGPAG